MPIATPVSRPVAQVVNIPSVTADPLTPNPQAGTVDVWYRSDTSQLCVRDSSGTVKRSGAFA